jgi:hypothetical protein
MGIIKVVLGFKENNMCITYLKKRGEKQMSIVVRISGAMTVVR